MESLNKAGQEMSLAALKQHDPYITSIADVTGQVALYRFSPKANEWVSGLEAEEALDKCVVSNTASHGGALAVRGAPPVSCRRRPSTERASCWVAEGKEDDSF